MILKWIDHSGVPHTIDGIEEAANYGSRHWSSSDAIAKALGLEGCDRRQYPDVYYVGLDEARDRGHVLATDLRSPDDRKASISELRDSDYSFDEVQVAAWTSDGVDPDRVSIAHRHEGRSYGVCVCVRRDGRTEVLHLDATEAWLMNDAGVTVDRMDCGVLHGPPR